MVIQEIWQELLKTITEEVGSRVVETWLRTITFTYWDSAQKVAYLSAPNKFAKEWVKTHYLPILEFHLSRLLNTDTIKVTVELPSQENSLQAPSFSPAVPLKTANNFEPASVATIAKTTKNRSNINPNYSFDAFVVGPNNALAVAAAQATAQKPGKFYNPLFIYGGSGLGKTHLLHAIGNSIKETNKRAVVLYQPADRFVHEFINAIRFDKVAHFESKYKEVDVLLIDDIQSISNKEQTQEAFFHIFNALHDNHKQIVFSSDTFPRDIKGIAERLRSRLEWGMIADIQMPTLETKIAIVKKKADLNGCHLTDEVAQFIASRALNVRTLEGALIRVVAFAHLTQQEISLGLAQKVLCHTKEEKKSPVDLDKIATAVTRYYKYSLTELRSDKRHKDLVIARQVAMYLMKSLTDRSLQEIGAFLLRKNHSTVIHAFDRIEKQKAQDTELAEAIEQIKKQVI